MKLEIVFIIIVILSFFQISNTVFAEVNNKIDLLPINEYVTKDTNLHFTGKYCDECHDKTPDKNVNAFLKYGGDFNQLCVCHNYSVSNYIHPVGIEPSDEKKSRMPTDFHLQDGELSCGTCHDISLQCQKIRFNIKNKKFLRGGPYSKRTDICFKCHDEKKYKQYDPHKQLNAEGDIIEDNCRYCHVEKPDETSDKFEDIKLIGDIRMICLRCHKIPDKHPSGKDHFRMPKAKMLTTMKVAEIIFTTVLPLDQEGRITCITCHNPHEKGAIPDEREGAKGADVKDRNRLAGIVCDACHNL